jgi:hypothetical protein
MINLGASGLSNRRRKAQKKPNRQEQDLVLVGKAAGVV